VPSPIDVRLAPLYEGEPVDPPYAVLALRYGTCVGTRGRYFRGVEPGEDADAPVRMDFFLWTITGGERAIVVDTGFDPSVAERRRRTCLAAPRSLLARVGVEPATVETVVLTHLHYDHTGNVDAFPHASFHVHRRELEFWHSADAKRPESAAVAEPRELAAIDAAVDAGRVREIENDRLIAPGVLALWTGGHAPGQLIIVVRSGNALVVVASDALHFYEELDGGPNFAIFSDLEEMNEGYELLRELARRGAVVVPGHDPLVLDRFPRLEGELSELGVRVA
jgi:glyoxylase-like metal-dependent hydrolase (beta-lactamase superfamily II)